MVGPLKKELFFAASLIQSDTNFFLSKIYSNITIKNLGFTVVILKNPYLKHNSRELIIFGFSDICMLIGIFVYYLTFLLL